MQFRAQKKSKGLIINVTSLIDVMFLLLIFFMVSSTFKYQPAINLVLPRSVSAEDTPVTPAVVFLTENGEVFINDVQVERKDVGAALLQLQSNTGEERIFLRADANADHGDVVKLIDLVKTSGFTRVSISAKRLETP